MTESVADKTPTPSVTVWRHTDPPGLWIAILSCSVMLHASAFLLLRAINFDSFAPQKTSTIIPIDVIRERKSTTKPGIRTIQQPLTPSSKNQSRSPQAPKILPQKVPPVIPVTPQQDTFAKLSQGIALTNPAVTKTKPAIKPKVEKKAPPKPQLQNQAEQQFQRELAEQQRRQRIAEQQFKRNLAEQQRQQRIAEQQLRRAFAEQQRQQKLAEQQRQRRIAAQQRQQELAEQQRQRRIAEQQRQQELAEQQRQQRIAEQQRRADEVARNQRGEIPKSSDTVAVNKNPPPPPGGRVPTETTGGFWTASLSPASESEQIDLNSITGEGTLESPPQMKQKTTIPNRSPLLDEKDRQLITQPITCRVLLSIDASGKIFKNNGIRIADDAAQKDVCKRYAEEYFKQNQGNIEFIPRRDKGNVPASGGLFVDLIIQTAASSEKITN
ncbi:hypothetical protein NIES4101_76390 [Calothrix sp. NIES-4101]|nr:hypothetical protein NIES4101_76390 [Calothrix sp. NIES-4101]